MYVYNKGINGNSSTISINPDYIFPEGEDIADSSIAYLVYRETEDSYIIGYYRDDRRISSDENVAKIDRENKTITVNYWSIGNITSPWAIDPEGVINDGLPYLKFVPMLVEQDVIYYGAVDNEYRAFARPKENTGTSQEFSKEDFDSYNSRLTINNEYQRDENGNVYLGQIANEGADPTYFVYCETIYYDEAGNEVSANDNYTRVQFTYWTSWDDLYSKALDGLKYRFEKNENNAHGKLYSNEFIYF